MFENNTSQPFIKIVNGEKTLFVHGRPYVILGGEVRNSSSSTAEFMEPIWEHLKKLNANSVFLPVSWKQIEPTEGVFDFSVVDALINRARDYGLKLILLWLATWKNGYSGYAPTWVLADEKRFPRMSPLALSPFGRETLEADCRAFSQLMEHIKNIDREYSTVIMMQVENETGMLDDSRDRTDAAEKAFNSPVPEKLLKDLYDNFDNLTEHMRELLKANGMKREGTWSEVFGNGIDADEAFMAWHIASYINTVAAAGKDRYNIPMYVNAWPRFGQNRPGQYPSGGPAQTVLDIWMSAAPEIDVLAIDTYRMFKQNCSEYRHRGNPLFIPECGGWWTGDDHPDSTPQKAFYAVGEGHCMAFSPFAIDFKLYENHPLGEAYRVLNSLMPLICRYRGTKRLRGFYPSKNVKNERITLDGYIADITYRFVPTGDGGGFDTTIGTDRDYQSYGLVIQTGDREFIVAGRGLSVDINLPDQKLYNKIVEEGYFENGLWHTTRVLNGDEVGNQGLGAIVLPAEEQYSIIGQPYISVQRVRFF